MKKLFLITLSIVVFTGIIIAGSINVTNPHGGDTFIKGEVVNISWTVSGCTDTNFKINSFRNSTDPSNFIEQLLTSGVNSKNWTIPMGYASGNYVIRVKTADNACRGDSGVFSITDPSSPGPGTAASITVTSPTTGTKWAKGTTKTITWDKSGDLDSNVKINIFRNSILESNFVVQLTGPNTGSKSWNIPSSYDPGTYYLRIKENVGTVQGDSRAFEITNQMYVLTPLIATMFKPHSIEITEPSGRDLALNSRMRILWRPKNLTNNVKISLMKNGEFFGVIEENLAPGRISTEWTIGRTLIKTTRPDSGFKIKIEEMGTAIFAESNTFSI
ncbi:MAG: hypothetical protein KAR14_10025, partial [Candidatus Aminicenantes bacterium]|nr:hypothetical protein [Candidatus Aminicenantes bacterium]